MGDQTQRSVAKIVKQYKKTFPLEYNTACAQIKANRDATKSIRELAKQATRGNAGVERPMHEVPETLFNLLYAKLTAQEFTEFHSKEGALAFMKKYPEFAITEA